MSWAERIIELENSISYKTVPIGSIKGILMPRAGELFLTLTVDNKNFAWPVDELAIDQLLNLAECFGGMKRYGESVASYAISRKDAEAIKHLNNILHFNIARIKKKKVVKLVFRNKRIIGIVSEQYMPIFLGELVQAFPEELNSVCHVVDPHLTYGAFTNEEWKQKSIGEYFPAVYLLNGYTGRRAFEIRVGLFKLACLNGLALPIFTGAQRIIHRIYQKPLAEKLWEILNTCITFFSSPAYEEMVAQLISPITPQEVENFVEVIAQRASLPKGMVREVNSMAQVIKTPLELFDLISSTITSSGAGPLSPGNLERVINVSDVFAERLSPPQHTIRRG